MRCHGEKTRMQARLLLSQESFSFEKKPQIWRLGAEVGEEGSRREKTRRK